VPASCPRSRATHSALPQVRPEPSRGLPHRQAGRRRASHAAYASNSAGPPVPGTETTGRIWPPGSASHSRGLSAAGLPGIGPMAPSSPLRNPASPLSQPIPARPDPPRVTQGLSRKPWVKTTLAPGSKVVTDHYERAGLVPTWTSSGSAWSATAAARASRTPGICRPRSARRSTRTTCPWYWCSGRCVRRPAGRPESAEEVRVRDWTAVRGRGLPGAVRLDPPHPRVRARR
jgi:hypothetical protein